MVKGVKKDYGDVVYMRFKKHMCPECGNSCFVKKVKRKIDTKRLSDSQKQATGTTTIEGKVKFIWYEFRCTGCGNQYTEAEMKKYETEKQAAEKAAKKAAKKAEKKAKKAEKKAEKRNLHIELHFHGK